MTVNLLYLVSHPIQYQAPLLKRVAAESDIRFRVIFEHGRPTGPRFDPGFGRDIQWDLPLTEGYDNTDLADTDLERQIHWADVVWIHGWQTPTLRRALGFALGMGTPVLMRGENCDIAMPDGTGLWRLAKRFYLKRIFRRCSAFLTIGSANARYYRDRGVAEERLFHTPYAIDNDRFAADAAAARPGRAALRAEIGVAPERPVVLFVGKLMARKRPDLLARAFMNPTVQDLNPALVFAGTGEQEETVRALAPGAFFLGFCNQRDLPALYDLADVLVLPSEGEPWGLVINEAMACATAVVTSDQVGCASDLVTPACGAMFPSGDADALAAAIVHCLENAGAMGRAAREAITPWSFEADLRGLRQAIDFVTGTAADG